MDEVGLSWMLHEGCVCTDGEHKGRAWSRGPWGGGEGRDDEAGPVCLSSLPQGGVRVSQPDTASSRSALPKQASSTLFWLLPVLASSPLRPGYSLPPELTHLCFSEMKVTPIQQVCIARSWSFWFAIRSKRSEGCKAAPARLVACRLSRLLSCFVPRAQGPSVNGCSSVTSPWGC